MTGAALPVIDIGGLRSEVPGAHRAVVAALRDACTTTGFFYVADHGVPADVIAEIFAAGRRFFDQPLAAKERIGFRRNRGYDGIGRQTLDQAAGRDIKESIILGVDLAADHPLVVAGLPNHAVNPWPENLPGWRDSVRRYFAAMDRLSRQLLRGLALSLALPEDFFEPGLALPMSSVRLLHYPAAPTGAATPPVGAGAHSDWGLITILAQDQVGGLEVQLPSGAWIGATPLSDTFVVNLGDMMARWTNDRYASTPHRVINRAATDRYSVAFFCDPGYHTPVECLPSCTGVDRPPRYAPTTCGAHLAEMYARSYGAAAGTE
jgi:isopenicillin N synthase-like dioxygenase